MTPVLKTALKGYTANLGRGKVVKAEMMKSLIECCKLLDEDLTDEAFAARLLALIPSVEKVEKPVTVYTVDDAKAYINSTDLSASIKNCLCTYLTDEHSKRFVEWTVKYVAEKNLNSDYIHPWFRYPQWRVPFMEMLASTGNFNYWNLESLNPAVCEYFASELLNVNNSQSAIDFFGGLNPVHSYFFSKDPQLLEDIKRRIDALKFTYKGKVYEGDYYSISVELANRIAKRKVPANVREFSNKYFVPYGKLLSYRDNGADRYRCRSILEIWADVTGAKSGKLEVQYG